LQLGLTCIRSDQIGLGGSIHQQMFINIVDAPYAIVDASTLNPNVMYELGARHALRPRTTVVMAKKGSDIPFNIAGFRIIEYDPRDESAFEEIQSAIIEFIRNSDAEKAVDSVIHYHVKDIKILRGDSEPISDFHEHRFAMLDAPGRILGIATGNLADVRKGIADVWVNPENTNMEMARAYDPSISGMIRYYGAIRDNTGYIEIGCNSRSAATTLAY